ncbi:MAG: four helix bundle protein [Deltaproteobacteria bacterium]|nr:four helix bundle protein [Deltaproteobacteria bacterium]
MTQEGNVFSFQRLLVWQKAVEFAELVFHVIDKIDTPRRHYRLIEQLEAASTSISMNIAEGKGRQTTKEFIQYLYIARGSLFETITLLVIFKRTELMAVQMYNELQKLAEEITKMINALIKSMK